MNYYIDTEFLEGTQKENFPISLFRKNTLPTIDLISIGIVSEDGREYYAISKDFNLKEAWNRFQVEEQTPFEKYNGFSGKKVYWIRENVLIPILKEIAEKDNVFAYGEIQYFTYSVAKKLIKKYGKTNKQIALEIQEFVYQFGIIGYDTNIQKETTEKLIKSFSEKETVKFYAYYADYDWVAFCWLFGKMIDLPKGFPMYCNDLKQEIDAISEYYNNTFKSNTSFEERLESMKNLGIYPKKENEHHALADARWNKKLHEFLSKI